MKAPWLVQQLKQMAKNKEKERDRPIAQGNVSTHASAWLRRIDICTPEPLAAIVPATPEESTCVVETGGPKLSASGPARCAESQIHALTKLALTIVYGRGARYYHAILTKLSP